MREQGNPDQAEDAGYAADHDGHQLLEAVGDTDEVEYPDGREQPNEMADEDYEDADVEQVRAPHQLAPTQQLARSRLPRVLLAIEAKETAEQEHGQAEVGVPAKHDVIDGVAHGTSSDAVGLAVGDDRALGLRRRDPRRGATCGPHLGRDAILAAL